ncbi:hypothetical protein [Vagococcus carniphilus]|uniref:hypothetical protein n=1 Tax=Vagococcus carniphilus TaxID=218144 RepID=UPI003B58F170
MYLKFLLVINRENTYSSKWEQKGLLTVIDEPTISPKYVVECFVKAREKYGITKIVADNFCMEILGPLLRVKGFEVMVIKNPRAADSLLAPRIEDAFANNNFIFGDKPLMRWYTNNVLVKTNADGK